MSTTCRIAIAVLSLIFCGSNLAAESVQPAAPVPQMNEFAALPPMEFAQLSPDGKRIASACPLGARFGICVLDTENKQTPAIKFSVASDNAVQDIRWGSNEHVLITMKTLKNVDSDGGLLATNKPMEYRRIYSFNITTKKGVVLLQNLGGTISYLDRISNLDLQNKVAHMQVSIYEDEKSLDYRTYLYEVDLDSGRGKRIKTSELNVRRFILDAEGKPLAEEVYGERSNFYAVRANSREKPLLQEENAAFPSYLVGHLSTENSLIVQQGEGRGLVKLGLDGKIMPIEFNGNAIGDNAEAIIEPYKQQLVGFKFWDGQFQDQVFTVPLLQKIKIALTKALPQGRVIIDSWSQDHSQVLISLITAGRPVEYYRFNKKDGVVEFIESKAAFSTKASLPGIQAFSYKARDGMPLEGFYQSIEPKNLPRPAILLPHGGPHSFASAEYDWLSSYFASLGYLVIQPNFRGSAGYGYNHLKAGFGEFGGKMVTDVLDAYTDLVNKKLARPGGACIIGASYGGYSAVQAALLAPDTIKCIVSINPVTAPHAFVRGSMPRGTSSFDFWYQYLGAETQNEKPYSLVENANKLAAPLLLISGEKDRIVPFVQSEKLASVLQKKGESFKWLRLPEDDHYLMDSQSRSQTLIEATAWLNRYFPVK